MRSIDEIMVREALAKLTERFDVCRSQEDDASALHGSIQAKKDLSYYYAVRISPVCMQLLDTVLPGRV